tara:strand:+ start:1163 stop:1999 length:837 start_codon:yes stop_codon:yes gene_type:complete
MFIYKLLKKIIPPIILEINNYIVNFFILNFTLKNEVISKNYYLKDKRKKNRAFLIATGPSLRKENLKLLNGEDCFTLSNAFLLKEIKLINPILHFFTPYHLPITKRSFYDWLLKSDKELPKKTDIMMNYDDRNFKTKKLFNSRNVYFLKISGKINKFHSNIQKPVPKFQTGSLMVLNVLLSMGYKKIYILGCDHNQLKNFNSQIDNFYKESRDVRLTKISKLNQNWGKLDEELSASLLAYNQYKEINKIAKQKNIEIINLSKESWIDLFKKESLKKII